MRKLLLSGAIAALCVCASAQEVPTGKVFIRNVKTGWWLNGGYSWGTKAILKKQAREFEIVQNGGGYYLQSANGYLKYGGEFYIDGSEGERVTIDIQSKGDGKFALVYEGKNIEPIYTDTYADQDGVLHYINDLWPGQYNINTYDCIPIAADATAADGEENVLWEFLTRDEMIKEMTEKADADNLVDATFLIKAHYQDWGDTDNNTAWVVTKNGQTESVVYPDPGWGFELNDWHNRATYGWFLNDEYSGNEPDVVSQSVSDAPAGVYTVQYRVINQSNTPLKVVFNNTEAEATPVEGTDFWYRGAADLLCDKNNLKLAVFDVADDNNGSVEN